MRARVLLVCDASQRKKREFYFQFVGPLAAGRVDSVNGSRSRPAFFRIYEIPRTGPWTDTNNKNCDEFISRDGHALVDPLQ